MATEMLQAILVSKFWALGGPKSKIEEQRFVEGVMEN